MSRPQFPYLAKEKVGADCLGEFGKAVGFGAFGGAWVQASVGWWSGMALRKMYPDILRGSALYGGLFGTFYGVQCMSANLRHSDDIYNAPIAGFITGILVGMRGGTLPRIAFASTALAFGALAFEKISREYDRVSPMTKDERRKDLTEGFFKVQHDPYAERWAKIQAREAESEA
ncbi:hypothetical protein HDU67_000226 [Dinochytrium kinnereticum]|nr:hypothetical protein HDU67_000226 [Dinochytrium kinnereticum]